MQSASGVSTTHGEVLTYAGQIWTYAERAFNRSVCGQSSVGETGEIGAEAIASFGAPKQQRRMRGLGEPSVQVGWPASWLAFASDVRLKRLSVNRPDRPCGGLGLEGILARTLYSGLQMDSRRSLELD